MEPKEVAEVAPSGPEAPAEPEAPPEPEPRPDLASETRCGEERVQIGYWQGEYPSPVVNVKAAVTVPAFADPCDAKPTRECALAPGLYHPWGEGKYFVTLRPVERYRAGSAFQLGFEGEAVSVGAGDEVVVEGYQGEGFCSYRVGEREVSGECPGVGSMPLERVGDGSGVSEHQLFQGACGLWVQVDEALFARPEIAEGQMPTWGEVAP